MLSTSTYRVLQISISSLRNVLEAPFYKTSCQLSALICKYNIPAHLGIDHLEEGDVKSRLLQLALDLHLLSGCCRRPREGVDESQTGDLERGAIAAVQHP